MTASLLNSPLNYQLNNCYMKKLFLITVFLLISLSMQSQVLIALLLGNSLNTGKIEFGLDGGVNFAQIGNMDSNGWHRKWNLGFYFDFKMKNQWYLNTGVLVKADYGLESLTTKDLEFLNATTYDVDGSYDQIISYFVVPALAKYKFDNNIYVEMGPQFALMHKAYIDFNYKEDGIKINAQEDNKDMVNRIDMGLAAGAGYRLLKGLGWSIGARYYYGLLDVYKDQPGTRRNQALFLKLLVPIGLSDDKKAIIDEMKATKHAKKEKKKEAKKAAKSAKHDS